MKKDTPQKVILSNPPGSIKGIGVLAYKQKVYLYYQKEKSPHDIFSVASSSDGFSFKKEKKFGSLKIGKYTKIDLTSCKNFSFSEQGNYLTTTFVYKNLGREKLAIASSSNPFTWEYEGVVENFQSRGSIVSNYILNNQQILYLPDNALSVMYSKDRIFWKIYANHLLHKPLDSIGCTLFIDNKILLIFYRKESNRYAAYAAFFDKDNPATLLWESSQPIWIQPDEWQGTIEPLGIVLLQGKLIGYWQVEREGIFGYVYALYGESAGYYTKNTALQLKRHEANPIICPNARNNWEAFNTFNPAAICDDGKVHILYRAQGYDYVSCIGYATSKDGIHIDERSQKPIYFPRESFEWVSATKLSDVSESYISGGGYGGCEDPRITKIDGRYYLTYVAFDGYHPPRVALTSIDAQNFLKKKWQWEKPVLISPPDIVDKSAVIFPEKINGKYVIMHRIYPDILIDFVDNLAFDGKTWLKGQYKISPRRDKWDSRKIGAGAPPIRTKYGWLLIYQSVGEQDSSRYKMGAMILAIDDPTKVLYRSPSPILEPDALYENDGFKAGVIYPCGAVVINNILYIYYGGADSYVCVATANLDQFLDELKYSQFAKMTTPIIEKISL